MVGQLDQLIPPEYVVSFEPMLMQAPKTKFRDVKEIVEMELNVKSLDEIFVDFEEEPLASASLG